jgi:uncharacterized protein
MPISMYQASVPAFQKHLEALDGILDKALAHAVARKVDPSVLLNARLFPDMWPLVRQVQATGDFAKNVCARLAGLPVPAYADTETTIPELKTRIATTLAFLSTIKPEQMEGSETTSYTFKVGPQDRTFTGHDYLMHFALPNFYFHASTAYNILRHNGVEVGKLDFMRRMPLA